jgi:AraC-like DNA-binding protein
VPVRELPSATAIVPALLRYLAARGRDAADAATRLGLAPEVAELDEARVAPSLIGEAIALAAALLGEPHLALRLPAELPLRRYALAELAVRASSTARDALLAIARYAAVVHPQLAFELIERDDEALWYQRAPHHPRGIGRHCHEYALAYVHAQLPPLALQRAWFAHARPPSLAPLHRAFGTRSLGFGEPDSGFAFARAALDLALPTSDPRLLATVTGLADAAHPDAPSTALAPRIAAQLRDHLTDAVTADDAAAAMHMSARTLQRRLEAEGTTFSDVLDATREEVARALLGDPALALAEVAYRAGFADLATFSRAFKRWTGKPPGQFRRS